MRAHGIGEQGRRAVDATVRKRSYMLVPTNEFPLGSLSASCGLPPCLEPGRHVTSTSTRRSLDLGVRSPILDEIYSVGCAVARKLCVSAVATSLVAAFDFSEVSLLIGLLVVQLESGLILDAVLGIICLQFPRGRDGVEPQPSTASRSFSAASGPQCRLQGRWIDVFFGKNIVLLFA